MRTRFGSRLGGNLAHISVVVYAMVATVGFLSYAFQGIGKFAEVFFPWDLSLRIPLGVLATGEAYAIMIPNAHMYGISILLITTAYLILGGWYSVVLTDLIQFFLLTIASIFIAVVAMMEVSPEALSAAVPGGWNELFFGWKLDLDWTGLIDELNHKIYAPTAQGGDGFSLFGMLMMIMLFKGLLVSMAGPTPGYGIQHVLSTRNPREAALENWWMSIVQLVPRFLMITGIAVLGLVFFSPEVKQMLAEGQKFDFETILPHVIQRFLRPGLVGILMAGLLAAFMSTFDSTVNAGAAYVVNDVYKRYIDSRAPAKRYIYMSYFCSVLLVAVAIVVGMNVESIHGITKWITSALYGGYIAPNVLKWHWWRFNGYGYFAGMMVGVAAALIIPWCFPGLDPLLAFPVFLLTSTVASVVVCLLTPPESDEVLESFYRDVRPWGFWNPVYEKITRGDPNFRKNEHFWRDAFNVANGIVWQLTLMVIPVCIVIREYPTLWISVAVLVVTSIIMKFTWYDKLGPGEMYTAEDG